MVLVVYVALLCQQSSKNQASANTLQNKTACKIEKDESKLFLEHTFQIIFIGK